MTGVQTCALPIWGVILGLLHVHAIGVFKLSGFGHGFSFMDEHLTEWFDMICHGTNNRNDILGRLCSQTTVRSIIYSSIALSKLACN